MEQRSSPMDFVWRFLLLACAISILFPLIWVLYQSLKTNIEFFQDIWALPQHWKWSNYSKAWNSYDCLLYTSPSPRD